MSAQHSSAVIATHAEMRGRASLWKKTSPSPKVSQELKKKREKKENHRFSLPS
jgi:hypothetical protein